MSDIGKQIRLNRILRPSAGKALIVAYDHAQMLGPIPGTEKPAAMIERLAEAEVDGLLLSLGALKNCGTALLCHAAPAVIARLDWTNVWYRPGAVQSGQYSSCTVADVEDAISAGADAVVTYMFLGSGDPARDTAEIRKNAEVARACERFGMPHIIESMARGQEAPDPCDPEWVRRHTRMASELGADLIKTDYTGDADSMRSVVEACPTPVLAAGGPRQSSDEHSLEMVRGVAASGAAGVIFGRNIFQASDMRALIARAREALRAEAAAC